MAHPWTRMRYQPGHAGPGFSTSVRPEDAPMRIGRCVDPNGTDDRRAACPSRNAGSVHVQQMCYDSAGERISLAVVKE
jgi:hypothetical protein